MSPAKLPQNGSQPSPVVMQGETLRMLRKSHKVSLRYLASRVGISASHLSRVESGERQVSQSLVNRICSAIATLPISDEDPAA